MAKVMYNGRLIDEDEFQRRFPGMRPDQGQMNLMGTSGMNAINNSSYVPTSFNTGSTSQTPIAGAERYGPWSKMAGLNLGGADFGNDMRSGAISSMYGKGDATEGMNVENARLANLWKNSQEDSKNGYSWLTKENMDTFSAATGGISNLAKAWTAMKTLGLTRQAYADANTRWQKDYDANKTVTNNQIRNNNEKKRVDGRTDYSNLVT